MEIKCQDCGKSFEAKRTNAKRCSVCKVIKIRASGRNSSQKCRYDLCPECGKRKYKKAKYCLHCVRQGERCHFWRGGIHKSKVGYVYLYAPDHPKVDKFHGTYVAEHRLVWEKEHGQLLPDGWLIHHINGIKDDNRPENLVALKPDGHSKNTLVKILQERIRELEKK